MNYSMKEYELYDGEAFITFNIIGLTDREITVAITNRGKISVQTFDLKSDGERPYFEYGLYCEKIYIDEFEMIVEGGSI